MPKFIGRKLSDLKSVTTASTCADISFLSMNRGRHNDCEKFAHALSCDAFSLMSGSQNSSGHRRSTELRATFSKRLELSTLLTWPASRQKKNVTSFLFLTCAEVGLRPRCGRPKPHGVPFYGQRGLRTIPLSACPELLGLRLENRRPPPPRRQRTPR